MPVDYFGLGDNRSFACPCHVTLSIIKKMVVVQSRSQKCKARDEISKKVNFEAPDV